MSTNPTAATHSRKKLAAAKFRSVIVSYAHDVAQATRVLAIYGLYEHVETPREGGQPQPYARFQVNAAIKSLLRDPDVFGLLKAQAEELQRLLAAPVETEEDLLTRSKLVGEYLGSSNQISVVDSAVLQCDDPDEWFEATWKDLWPVHSPFVF